MHNQGLSLGEVGPDHVIATTEGLALAILPAGSLAQCGPSDLRPVASFLRRSRKVGRGARPRFGPGLTATA